MARKDLMYKNYVLYPVPYPRQNDKWSADVCIMKDFQGTIKAAVFHSPTLWSNKEEADIHSIAFGKRVVDGEVEGSKVPW